MWRDSLARCALAGWMRSPSRFEHARDRVLGEPVDLEVGLQAAQLARDRHVALRVAEPDRRGDEQRARAPVGAVDGRVARRARPRRRRPRRSSRSARFTSTGLRACGMCPPPRTTCRRAAGRARRARGRRASGVIASRSPWTTSTGQRRRRGQPRAASRRSRGIAAAPRSRSASRGRSRAPTRWRPRCAFVECGSGKQRDDEPLGELAVVLAPVHGVHTPPPAVRPAAARRSASRTAGRSMRRPLRRACTGTSGR